MNWQTAFVRTAVRGAFVFLAAAWVGCGGASGPARYALSGTVSYAGKPVPAGEISFEPDGAQGNRGPGSMARIRAGRYQTEPDKGLVGGPYIVRIVGFDGVSVPDSSDGAVLFPPQEMRVEFPRQATTRDFTVPASPGAGP